MSASATQGGHNKQQAVRYNVSPTTRSENYK